MKTPTNKFIECMCGSDEHTLKFTIERDEFGVQLYTSVFLSHWAPWYARVWLAVKYVFGYKCKYGHFDTTLMNSSGVQQLQRVIDEFNEESLYFNSKKPYEVDHT